MKKINEGVPKFMKGSIDPFPRGRILFLGGTNILRSELGLLGRHVKHRMCQDVSLVKRVQKDLENSIAEFTEYLNSCLFTSKKIMFLKANSMPHTQHVLTETNPTAYFR